MCLLQALEIPAPAKVALFVLLIKWVFALKSHTTQRKQNKIKMSFVFCFSIICEKEVLGLYHCQWKVPHGKETFHSPCFLCTGSLPWKLPLGQQAHIQMTKLSTGHFRFSLISTAGYEGQCLKFLEKFIVLFVLLWISKPINWAYSVRKQQSNGFKEIFILKYVCYIFNTTIYDKAVLFYMLFLMIAWVSPR